MYDQVATKYGDKAGHKIDVTVADKTKTVEDKKKDLERKQKAFDDAPIGKEDRAEKELAQAQEEYDNAVADLDFWNKVKKESDRETAAENERRWAEREAQLQRAKELDDKKREAALAEAEQRQKEREEQQRREKEENRIREQQAEANKTEIDRLEDDALAEVDSMLNGMSETRVSDVMQQVGQQNKIRKAKEIYGETIDLSPYPQNVQELVAMNLPGKIRWSSERGERSLRDEMGGNMSIEKGGDLYEMTQGEKNYIATDKDIEQGEAITFDEAVHSVYESDDNILPDGNVRYTDSEIRNAVIGLFAGSRKPSDIGGYWLNNRVAQAETLKRAEENAYAGAALDEAIRQRTGGLTLAEYEAELQNIKEKAEAVAGLTEEEYNNLISGEYDRTAETDLAGTETEGAAESGVVGRDGEKGAETLRGEESVGTGAETNDAPRADEDTRGTAEQPAAEVEGEKTPQADWEEHRKQVLDTYDKEYERLEQADGERLRNEARNFSNERLLNYYIKDSSIANIFGEGREVFDKKFISSLDHYKPEKLEEVKETHLEAALDAARQSFVIDILKAELDRRGIKYKDKYEFKEYAKASDWLKNNKQEQPNEKQHKVGEEAQPVSEVEAALRDGVINDLLRESGLETFTDEIGQRVLDNANGGVQLNKAQKRALETVSFLENQDYQQTVVSSTDGAKILKNLDKLAKKLENLPNNPVKTFIGELGKALEAEKRGSNSEYANFVTDNGVSVTIRLADHNANVENFDRKNEDYGISIVISHKKDSEGIKGKGKANIVEFFYNDIKLRKKYGKPLAEIVHAVEDALHTGEFVDPTGIAKREEVNAEQIQLHKVYHGSGALLKKADGSYIDPETGERLGFDSSHMGEGEGAQAYGYGHYTTEVEGIGRTYAEAAVGNFDHLYGSKYKGKTIVFTDLSRIAQSLLNEFNGDITKLKSYLENEMARAKERGEDFVRDYDYNKIPFAEVERAIEQLSHPEDFDIKNNERTLYTVEIPDDNGSNYLEWDKPLTEKQIDDVLSLLDLSLYREGFSEKFRNGYEWQGEVTPRANGERAYHTLENYFGSAEKASKALHDLGYVGIKYPAQVRSGGREDNAKNYVIFDDGDLNITDKAKFFRTADGEAYGFTLNGKIYIDPRIATAETPVHEYGHLWADWLQAVNPEAFEQLKAEMRKQTDVLEFVKKRYPELKNEDDLLKEVFTHYSGKRGAERMRAEMKAEMDKANGVFEKAQVATVFAKLRDLLHKFWSMARDMFAGRMKSEDIAKLKAEDFADMMMSDLMHKVNPNEQAKARDKEYMDAVEKGDMETAQRMVLEAAKAAMPDTKVVDENGNPLVVYHGSPIKDITTFDKERAGEHTGAYGDNAIYTTDSENVADVFSHEMFQGSTSFTTKLGNKGKVYPLFLGMKNPFDLRQVENSETMQDILKSMPDIGNGAFFDSIMRGIKAGNHQYAKRFLNFDKLKELGYDGIIARMYAHEEGNDALEYGAFSPSQIKSADPVTYDDNGNVIPLSERFNSESKDIRYSKAEDSAEYSMGEILQFSKDPVVQKNIENGLEALRRIADGEEEITDAMRRDELAELGGTADIAFIWGQPGHLTPRGRYKGGEGFSKIIEKHGIDDAIKVVETIAKGEIGEPYGVEGGQRVDIDHKDHHTTVSLFRNGESKSWVLTGYTIDNNTDAKGRGSDLSNATQSDPIRTRAELGAALKSDTKISELFETTKNNLQNTENESNNTATPEEKRQAVERLSEKLHTPITVVEDVDDITSDNPAELEKMKRSQGWYDPVTHTVNVVLPNNRNSEDVAATVFHETVAHMGLREMIGEKNYDAFLDEVYKHLNGDLKQIVDKNATRAFLNEPTKEHEQHRRTQVDELIARIGENVGRSGGFRGSDFPLMCLQPVVAGLDAQFYWYRQRQGVFHHFGDNGFDFVQLGLVNIKHELVVNLQNHLGFQFAFDEFLVYVGHGNFYHVGGGALYGHVNGVAFGKAA